MKSSSALQAQRIKLGLFCAVFLLTACSSLSSEIISAETNSTPSVRPTASDDMRPTPSQNVSCEVASMDLLDNIAMLAQEGTGLSPVRGFYVKSRDFTSVYFVAMEFSATGIENQIGVWVSNKSDGSGAIFSADGFAKEFTDWFHADETDVAISAADPSIDLVRTCFK